MTGPPRASHFVWNFLFHRFGFLIFFVYILYINNIIMAKNPTTKKPAPVAPEKPSTKKGGGKKAAASVTSAREFNASSIYEPVSHHIYFDGYSYRVRASIGGIRYSQNFSSKKKAFEFRKNLGLTAR